MNGAQWRDEAVPILEYSRLPQESGVVYAIIHESLPLVYVGVTFWSLRKRIKDHIRSIERREDTLGLVQAWDTYGPEALRVTVLERGVPLVLLAAKEDYWLRTLGRDHELLNTQVHSNYTNNYEHQQVRGVRYLIYGSLPSTVSPFGCKEWVEGDGVGDIYAQLDDGITGGVGGSAKFFVAASIEGEYWTGGFKSGTTLTKAGIFTTYSTAHEMLTSFVTPRNRGSELVFRNLADVLPYFQPTLESLTNDGYIIDIIVDKQGHSVYCKIAKQKSTWYMRDIYALLPMPQKDLATLTGMEQLDIPAEAGRNVFGIELADMEQLDVIAEGRHANPDDPDQILYLRHDLETLLAAYEKYTSTLRDCYGISPGYTAGGTALRAFHRMITPMQPRREVETFARKAFFGGLLFLIWVRSHQDRFKVDISATYAATMLRQRLNTASGCSIDKEYPSYPGIYLCEVDCPKDLPSPFVPARSDYNTVWHTEAFRTYLCSNSLALARTLGYSIHVLEGFVFG